MYLNDKATLIGGIAMVVLAICLIVFLAAGSASADNNPFERDETADFLADVHDSETAVLISSGAGIIADGAIGLIVGVMLFVLFRDRSRILALLALFGIVAQGAVASVVDGNTLLLTIIADDFVNGGPEGVAAGDPAILELGRYVGMMTYLFTNVAFTSLGLGLLALGALLTWAPEGAINPPRFFGWIGILAGLSAWLAWSVAAVDIGFVFFIIHFLSSMILLLGLGGWLIMNRDKAPMLSASMS